MQSFLLILPNFLTILLGLLLRTKLGYKPEFWKYAEKLVFYVLFPPLLFTSVANSKISAGAASYFLTIAVTAMLLAVLSAWCVRYAARSDDWTHASVFQCGFRFNTYIGFAICIPMFGDNGFALLALLIAVWVPISNTIAVAVLAAAVARKEGTQGKSILKSTLFSVAKNPLIIATLLGLFFNLTGLKLPSFISALLKDLGSASLAMGLICIGAGLKITELSNSFLLIASCTVQRLIIVPAVAWCVAQLCGLTALEAGVLVLFAALPTAQSCYVMTATMRGNAPLVADVTTVQTLAAMVTLPFWLHIIRLGLS